MGEKPGNKSVTHDSQHFQMHFHRILLHFYRSRFRHFHIRFMILHFFKGASIIIIIVNLYIFVAHDKHPTHSKLISWNRVLRNNKKITSAIC